ncbi:MAG: ribonucleotide reductase subunit alpha [Rhodoferax sp.]|nr:ribonucleotide reductase subunit alpha [Rhodoferax sp.]
MISDFEGLLKAARSQPTAQRLLLVFANAELPDDASEEQRQHFAAGQGGALVPTVCVDKAPSEVTTFQALVEESSQTGAPWVMVFVAALSGDGGTAPSSDDARAPLQRMEENIRRGDIGTYIPFDREGQAVQLG